MDNLVYATEFIIQDSAPCSLNGAYQTSSSVYKMKNVKTNKWNHDLKVKFLQQKEELNKIEKIFNKKYHYLAVRYVWFLPKSKLFTIKREVSEKSTDIGNWFKIPDDVIFGRSKRYPGRLLNADDSMICIEQGDKLPSLNGKYVLKLKVQIRKLEDLYVRAEKEWPEILR